MFRLEQELPALQRPMPTPPFHQWKDPDGQVVSHIFRTQEGYLLRFDGQVDFRISILDRIVTTLPAPKVSQGTIDTIFHNRVTPLLDSHDGKLVLHASAVSTGRGALAFLGASGRGKSTLAAAFAKSGCPLITDDGLRLERFADAFLTTSTKLKISLWADSKAAIFGDSEPGDTNEKYHLSDHPLLSLEEGAMPLRAIYFLGPQSSGHIELRPMEPSAALFELIKQSFILDVRDQSRVRSHFEDLSEIAQAYPCFELNYPRRFDLLPKVISMILDQINNQTQSRQRIATCLET